MAVDLRQVIAAFLTFSMFVMLGNMIKKDHIDPLLGPYLESLAPSLTSKIWKPGLIKLGEISDPLRRSESKEPLKLCWGKPSSKEREPPDNGYIFFSLTNGPEFHASQVANAVAVARHLGAKLAIPDIRGTKLGEKWQFGEIYDVDKFVTSLKGIVQVDNNPPGELLNRKLPIVSVPAMASKEFIASKIEPIFRSKRSLKIVTYYYLSSKGKEDKSRNVYECMATYETLRLQSELQEAVDSMAETLRTLNQNSPGGYVAVDLRVDRLNQKICEESNRVRKRCYDAEEIGQFLENVGFLNQTTIYVTHTGWNTNLDGLRNHFPNSFTKDAIMGVDQKAKLMDSENHEYEKIIDFYLCAEGDVFVPAFTRSRFYSGVVGRRIGEGKTMIFIPEKKLGSDAVGGYVSPFVAKKSHFAYSCFC